MNATLRLIAIPLAVVVFSASAASAQNYAITWYSVDGGGNTVTTGGAYRLGSTIGQHDAGPVLSAGGQSASGGFWVIAGTPPPSPCPADFNQSGVVSVQDIFDFLAAYFIGCP